MSDLSTVEKQKAHLRAEIAKLPDGKTRLQIGSLQILIEHSSL
jgi:hypothetical protein